MDKEIFDLVLTVAKDFNEGEGKNLIFVDKGEETTLFGLNGTLDSLGLVNFIVAVEQALEDELDISIQLVSEKAMSQKTSPFLTIGTLVRFIERLRQEGE